MTYRLTLLDGKYTIEHTNGTNFKAYRNSGSEVWRDLTGDGLVLALVQRIEELESGHEYYRKVSQMYLNTLTIIRNTNARDYEYRAWANNAIELGETWK